MLRSYYFVAIILIVENAFATNEVKIVVPKLIDVRETAAVACYFDIGIQRLISVKWYKDDKEFYRYTPFSIPNEARITVKGVKISTKQDLVCNEKFCKIYLQELNANSSGIYKCEIAGEAPTFKVVQNQANMTVMVLPKRDPTIHGLSSEVYKYDETVSANCTSDVTSARTALQWFIDDQKANNNQVKSHTVTNRIEGFQLQYQISELNIRIDKSRYHGKNQIKLQCVGKIDRLPTGQPLIKETTTYISIAKSDNLKNQKLTHSEFDRNGSPVLQSFSHMVILVALAVLVYH